MSIRSSWQYLIKEKATTVNTIESEHKTDKIKADKLMRKQPVVGAAQCTSHTTKGMVSELIYNEQQSAISHILLPLLRQSGSEERWLLWVTPDKRLSRQWLVNSGLPLNKVVQLHQIHPMASIEAMEKALASGNYSVVLGWLPELSEYEMNKLQLAAQKGTALGFIMRPQKLAHQFISQLNRLHIHSIYYH
ncbi:SOS-induced cell division inhibitor SulA [Xenorhabdus szentirmaii]|uniref:SOS-induced cell division inhibitor SulA n=1 Tax=Xenorhabdus szentirmaii TaxID=290112 RepID=UPI00198F7B8B|nr:SOS-induced cell division inhibitor SulA [Xenorhabdus sp. 38]MBD2782097.1 cell division inhibitor SulA [Xenorhabdus sp. 38]